MNMKLKAAIPVALVVLLVVGAFAVQPANAATTLTLSPTSGTYIVNTPVPFSITGGNASATYNIYLDAVDTSADASTGTDGTGQFQYTFLTVGNHILSLRMATGGIVASASIYIQDLVNDMMPWITLALTFIVIFAVIGVVKGIFRKF